MLLFEAVQRIDVGRFGERTAEIDVLGVLDTLRDETGSESVTASTLIHVDDVNVQNSVDIQSIEDCCLVLQVVQKLDDEIDLLVVLWSVDHLASSLSLVQADSDDLLALLVVGNERTLIFQTTVDDIVGKVEGVGHLKTSQYWFIHKE